MKIKLVFRAIKVTKKGDSYKQWRKKQKGVMKEIGLLKLLMLVVE